jgi:hypothetical protein
VVAVHSGGGGGELVLVRGGVRRGGAAVDDVGHRAARGVDAIGVARNGHRAGRRGLVDLDARARRVAVQVDPFVKSKGLKPVSHIIGARVGSSNQVLSFSRATTSRDAQRRMRQLNPKP